MKEPPRRRLSEAEEDALLLEQVVLIEPLLTRVAKLRALLGNPTKMSSNSHRPPSQDNPRGRARKTGTKRRRTPRPFLPEVSRPLAPVTADLRAWFDAEPWRTGRELLEQLQAKHPGRYPDTLLRTLHRQLRNWRHEPMTSLVVGSSGTRIAAAKAKLVCSVARDHSGGQRHEPSGTSTREARRLVILIVAEHSAKPGTVQ